jgi:predicted LPLAT superfamily acyltransferase
MIKNGAQASGHWSKQNEQAGYRQVKFLLVLFRIFPVFILRLFAFPVGFFYFLFSGRGRLESKRFLKKISPFISDPKMAKRCRSRFGPLRHIVSFAIALVEKFQSWGGKCSFKDIHFQNDDKDELVRELEDGKGVLLVFSHLGNSELLRGLLNLGRTGVSRKIPVTAIMDMKVTAHFSRVLKELNPQSAMDIIGADEIGPQTAVLFQEKLEAGEMVVIAGDRTSAKSDSKNLTIPFFGEEAPFPRGVFYLAAMMKTSVYFVFSLRRGDLSLIPEYDMHVHKCSLSFDCSRKERVERSSRMARSFVSYLESYCKERPFQWYNFFDFWQGGAS